MSLIVKQDVTKRTIRLLKNMNGARCKLSPPKLPAFTTMKRASGSYLEEQQELSSFNVLKTWANGCLRLLIWQRSAAGYTVYQKTDAAKSGKQQRCWQTSFRKKSKTKLPQSEINAELTKLQPATRILFPPPKPRW